MDCSQLSLSQNLLWPMHCIAMLCHRTRLVISSDYVMSVLTILHFFQIFIQNPVFDQRSVGYICKCNKLFWTFHNSVYPKIYSDQSFAAGIYWRTMICMIFEPKYWFITLTFFKYNPVFGKKPVGYICKCNKLFWTVHNSVYPKIHSDQCSATGIYWRTMIRMIFERK